MDIFETLINHDFAKQVVVAVKKQEIENVLANIFVRGKVKLSQFQAGALSAAFTTKISLGKSD